MRGPLRYHSMGVKLGAKMAKSGACGPLLGGLAARAGWEYAHRLAQWLLRAYTCSVEVDIATGSLRSSQSDGRR